MTCPSLPKPDWVDPIIWAAAVGYSEPKGSVDYRISGSASVLHASGVNVTLAAGTDSERSSSRNDPWSIYAKLGYIVDWQKFG